MKVRVSAVGRTEDPSHRGVAREEKQSNRVVAEPSVPEKGGKYGRETQISRGQQAVVLLVRPNIQPEYTVEFSVNCCREAFYVNPRYLGPEGV